MQVIPWALNDSNSLRIASSRLDIDKTIFVGGLHGMLNAGIKQMRLIWTRVDTRLHNLYTVNWFSDFLSAVNI